MDKSGPYSSGPILSGNSSANRNSNKPIRGRIVAVYIAAAVGCLSDFDVTISGVEMPVTVFSKNNPSEGFYYPNTAAHLNTDGSVIADYYVSGVPIDDFINVKIENGEEGDEVEVTLLLDE